jgi:DeoR/GlpR family transcriptional regulator of sugar metabolism
VRSGFETKVSSPEKRAIAKYATRFIHENDVIMIDGGTTPMEIIPFLSHDNLTIITNSPYSALLAAKTHEQYTVICAGGLVRDISRTCVGPDTEGQIRSKHANAAFLSGLGLTPRNGLTEPNTLEIGVKLAMCESAETRIVVVEAPKLTRVSLHKVMPSDEIDIIVTDGRAPDRVVGEFEAIGVDVRVVSP